MTTHLTYEQVEKKVGKAKAPDAWRNIGRAGGFGDIAPNFDGGLSLAGISEEAQQEIEGILAGDEPETVESLSKLSRTKLEARAKELGLDGNTYTDKSEIAAAIVAKQAESEGE